MANADEYERAITAAETNPRNLTPRQKELLATLQNESGERGNRARAATGTSGSGDSWGIIR